MLSLRGKGRVAPSRQVPSSGAHLPTRLPAPAPLHARLTLLGAAPNLCIWTSSDSQCSSPLVLRPPIHSYLPSPSRAARCLLALRVHSGAVPAIQDRPKLGRHEGGHQDTAPTSPLFLRGDGPLSTPRMSGPSPGACCAVPQEGARGLRAGGLELRHQMLPVLCWPRWIRQTDRPLLCPGSSSKPSQRSRT